MSFLIRLLYIFKAFKRQSALAKLPLLMECIGLVLVVGEILVSVIVEIDT